MCVVIITIAHFNIGDILSNILILSIKPANTARVLKSPYKVTRHDLPHLHYLRKTAISFSYLLALSAI